MKKERGITLVSLVVTIIILIILAGVSINLTLGENGIITKSKQAKEKTEQAKLNEEIALNELYMQMEAEGGTKNDKSFSIDRFIADSKFCGSTEYTTYSLDFTVPEDVENSLLFVFSTLQGVKFGATLTSETPFELTQISPNGYDYQHEEMVTYLLTAKKGTIITITQTYTNTFNNRCIGYKLYY